ncbi:radical SAM family heme chaperone HemW [Buchnera aphidicola]|uniref:radical SAM family heme chaperone HemW n=1 Tax=Buchnera aphidicola TaxID=9 RepID=UPI00346454EA
MFKLIPMSLYIHIPWCLKKCEYCDFNVYVKKNDIPEHEYIQHLLQDLEIDLKLIDNREIQTIFIGGGTPSLFQNKFIQKLIQGIKKRALLSNSIEISIEANPKKIETKNFIHYRESGINRLSLGIQTFNEKYLKVLGRAYNTEEAIDSLEIAQKVFNNVNIDIMYGLPSQSFNDALLDVHHAIHYNPSHISWYQLMIEPNTIFYAKKISVPKENMILKTCYQGDKLLKKSGYKKYEISSYSKPNYICKHNLNYWSFGDYIGIGCGAHGKITTKNGTIIRTVKNKNPYGFMQGNYTVSAHTVSRKDIIFEYFMNTFRLYNPISKKKFTEQTKICEKKIKKYIDIAIQEGYLIDTLKYWNTTKKGKKFLNSLLEIFLS